MEQYFCENCGETEIESLEEMYCDECLGSMRDNVVKAYLNDSEFRKKYPWALKTATNRSN